MPLGIKPTVDFAFKKIFGSPENVRTLIGLLNVVLELPAPIVDVEILNPFNYQEFVGDKQIILDIRARDSTGRWLNIEMQVSVFLLHADQYDPDELRDLLPGVEFDQAIAVIEKIPQKTEDQTMTPV